ncbi:MAG: metallophosphoesterase family protein [Deltaproteobacteria bacterium]|nr:metallophosphoesterase family protein [Deltaproteobacteria bacterium]
MKIGVISDTHLDCRNQRLKDISNKYFCDCDLILHAGDLIDAEVLQVFGNKKVKAVYGNMDLPSVRRIIPEKMILDINGFRVGLIHGWGGPHDIQDRILKVTGHVDCLVYGHTHEAANEVRDGVLFFNPGSPTDKRFARHRTIGILTIDHSVKGEIIILQE